MIKLTDKETYFQIIEKFELVPYSQSRSWYEMHSFYKPERIIFLVNNLENPTMACFAHVRKMFGVKSLLIEDEAYKDSKSYTVEAIKSFYQPVVKMGYQIVETASNIPYQYDYEIAMRQAGFLKPVGLFSLPRTKIIDLTIPIGYSKNWKKNLKKTTKNDLFFEYVDDVGKADSDDFMQIYSSMTSLKSLQMPFNSELIEKLCSKGEFKLFFVRLAGKRIASTIIYFQDKLAVSLYAATDETARSTSASYFMYDELFKYLKSVGITSFDVGKLLPSTKPINNVFLFKNGIQGTHIQLNGEWCWYSSSFFRWGMYFVKKYLLKKNEI